MVRQLNDVLVVKGMCEIFGQKHEKIAGFIRVVEKDGKFIVKRAMFNGEYEIEDVQVESSIFSTKERATAAVKRIELLMQI